jgi:prenyltransferase beta subunit
MFPGSTILNYLFWMVMGLLQALVVAGAYEWLKHYKKSVTWWQMGLMYGCFLSCCLVVAGGFTLMGEYESHGGYYFIGFLGVPHIIIMAILLKFFVFRNARA